MTSGQEFSVEVRQDGAALRRHDLAQCRAIVLDLSGVSFLDSSGLNFVLQEHRRCECDGLDFRLVPGPEPVQRVFEMTGLTDRLVWANPVAETTRDGN